jgi:selenide,water dikinase
MGGWPITAMNIVCFPVDELPESILKEILAGGIEKINEAGAVLVGGHSIEDRELKYGLSVTGLVHPKKVLTNCKAQVGDRLILTKPLGTGIIATAIKGKLADEKAIQAMIAVSATLNKKAAETMIGFAPNACTDVTGFGLAGHLLEMAKGSRKSVLLDTTAIPIIPQAEEYARMGLIPAGAYKIRTFCEKNMSIDTSVNQFLADILFDPQTSGGLLISISNKNTKPCIDAMRQNGVDARIIGEVTGDHENGFIVVK